MPRDFKSCRLCKMQHDRQIYDSCGERHDSCGKCVYAKKSVRITSSDKGIWYKKPKLFR